MKYICHIKTSMLFVLALSLVACHTTREQARIERAVDSSMHGSHASVAVDSTATEARSTVIELSDISLWVPATPDTHASCTSSPADTAGAVAQATRAVATLQPPAWHNRYARSFPYRGNFLPVTIGHATIKEESHNSVTKESRAERADSSLTSAQRYATGNTREGSTTIAEPPSMVLPLALATVALTLLIGYHLHLRRKP